MTVGAGAALRAHPQLAPTVLRVAQGGQATLTGVLSAEGLRPAIDRLIDQSDAAPEDKPLLKALVQTIEEELRAYLTQAQLAPTEVVALAARVCGWIADVAAVKLGRPVAAP